MSKKIYFYIMNNIFETIKKIDVRYDLKGSTYGRRTIKNTLGFEHDTTIALKDNDFIDMKETFKVGEELKTKILKVLEMDA